MVASGDSTTAPAKLAYLQPVLQAVASQRIVGRREAHDANLKRGEPAEKATTATGSWRRRAQKTAERWWPIHRRGARGTANRQHTRRENVRIKLERCNRKLIVCSIAAYPRRDCSLAVVLHSEPSEHPGRGCLRNRSTRIIRAVVLWRIGASWKPSRR